MLSATLQSENLQRGLDILSGHFVATGLVVDDKPSILLNSIKTYANDLGMPIDVEQVPFDSSAVISDLIRPDFVLVDHRLDQMYSNYGDGLDAVYSIRQQNDRIPIFYYTAYLDDLFTGRGPHRSMVPRAKTMLADAAWTYFFDKGELEPGRQLNEFVQLIYFSSLGLVIERLRQHLGSELSRLLASKVVRVEESHFKIRRGEERGWVRLLDASGTEPEHEVPTRLLRRAGVGHSAQYCLQRIVEFGRGQVLSYFSPAPLTADQLSPRALRMLRALADED